MKKRTQSGIVRKGLSQEYYLVHFNEKELNNIKALEKAKLIFDVRVTWEHPGGNYQNPTQCRRCQKWGHGTKNFRMDAKCMICGGSSHDKEVCPVKEYTTKFICSNCGNNLKSNFWNCPSRKRVIEARARQKDNIHYDNGRFQNLPGRVSNNAHFSVNGRLIENHTHHEDHNHAHS